MSPGLCRSRSYDVCANATFESEALSERQRQWRFGLVFLPEKGLTLPNPLKFRSLELSRRLASIP